MLFFRGVIVLICRRLIQSSRVLDGQICYDIKDVNQIYEIYYTRFKLHKMIYNHKRALIRLILIVGDSEVDVWLDDDGKSCGRDCECWMEWS